ncbi:MAG: O-antigen ligase family protein [Clostridiaceae bacterium]
MIDKIIKTITIINNKFYFKILYLLVSLSFVSVLSDIPGLNLLNTGLIVWGVLLVLINAFALLNEEMAPYKIFLYIFIIGSLLLIMTKYRTGGNIKIFATNLILFFAMFTVDRKKNEKELLKEMDVISWVYFITASLLALGSLFLIVFNKSIVINDKIYGINIQGGGDGHVGLFFNRNALGIACALAIAVGIYLIITNKSFLNKILISLFFIINLITLKESNNRSGIIVLLTLLGVSIFMYLKRCIWRVFYCILILSLAATAFALKSSLLAKILDGRYELWIAGRELIKIWPLTGVGNSALISSLTSILPELNKYDVSRLPGIEAGGLHNIYIQIGAVYGIPMLSIFLLFIISLFVFTISRLDAMKGPKKYRITILVSLCMGIILVNFFESNLIFIISFISLLFWIYMGYIASLLKNR